jgi:hypothetical protein
MTPGSLDYAKLVKEVCDRCRRGQPATDALCDVGTALLLRRVAFVIFALLRGKARRLPEFGNTAGGSSKKGACG